MNARDQRAFGLVRFYDSIDAVKKFANRSRGLVVVRYVHGFPDVCNHRTSEWWSGSRGIYVRESEQVRLEASLQFVLASCESAWAR